MTGRVTVAVLALCLSWMTRCTQAEPHVLHSFKDVEYYANGGAPIIISINISQCTTALPKNLPAYSFTERLDFFTLTDVGISFNRETPVNGTRLKLTGPATRILAMNLDASGRANFQISDVDPETGNVVTSGQITCQFGSGFSAMAGSGIGFPHNSYQSVVNDLQAGYRVTVAGALSQCQSTHGNNKQTAVDNVQVYGEIIDHRFAFSSFDSVAFSKQTPFLDAQNLLEHGYGDVKLNKDGSIDVFYYEYRQKSTIAPTRQHWKCKLQNSFNFFTVRNS